MKPVKDKIKQFVISDIISDIFDIDVYTKSYIYYVTVGIFKFRLIRDITSMFNS